MTYALQWDDSMERGLVSAYIGSKKELGTLRAGKLLQVIIKRNHKARQSFTSFDPLTFLQQCCANEITYLNPSCSEFNIRDIKIHGGEGLRVRDFTESFFAYHQKIDTPESSIVLFSFTRKVGTIIFISFH